MLGLLLKRMSRNVVGRSWLRGWELLTISVLFFTSASTLTSKWG
jgi:hypothetical protein